MEAIPLADDMPSDPSKAEIPDSPRAHRRRGRGRKRRLPALAMILIAGAVVRLALWFWFQDLPIRIYDEREYDALASNIIEYGEFAFTPGEPVSIRPPLYPFVVSEIYELFGAKNYQAVRLLQAGVSLINAVLLYYLGKRIYDRRTGLWLAGLYALYPSLLGMNNLLLTEVQFTFLLSAALYLLVCAIQGRSIRLLVPTGIILGLGALTRSVLWLFLPVASVYIMAVWPIEDEAKGKPPEGEFFAGSVRPRPIRRIINRRLLAAAVLFLSGTVTIAPWAIRNLSLEKAFLPIDCMSGRNVMMGNYEFTPIYRSWDAISIKGEKSWDAVLATRYPAASAATQGQKDKLAMKYAVRYITSHPWTTAKRDVVKFIDFWGLERELIGGMKLGYFGPIPRWVRPLVSGFILGAYVAAVFTALLGAAVTPPSDRRVLGLLVLVIAFICGMHTLSFGHSRYHLPLMPLVLTFSASAVRNRRKIWKARESNGFALAIAGGCVLLIGWTWNGIVMESDKFLDVLGL